MTSADPRPKTGWLIARILLLMLLGLALGAVAFWAYSEGWLLSWRALPAPPEPAVQIRGATLTTVDVQTTSGALYRIDRTGPRAGWQSVDTPLDESNPDCEARGRGVKPLANVISRAAACVDYAEAGETVVYAVQQDGRVRYFADASSAYTALLLLIACPLGGALLGLVTGIVLALIRRRPKEAVTPAKG